MRARQLLSISLLSLVVTSTLHAQPKRGARPAVVARPNTEDKAPADKDKPDKPKPAPAEKPTGATTGNGDAASVEADLGAPPPKVVEQSGDTKPSPLTPAPDEFPKGAPPAAPADLDRLLADIAALRTRVAALTTTLFKSKLRVTVEAKGDDSRIEAITITLDDGVVFAAPERFSASDERVVYEHAVAPGQHVLGIDVERYDARNRQYRTWQNSRFAIVVPESQTLETKITIDDRSGMAADFPDDKDGEYELRAKLRARVTNR